MGYSKSLKQLWHRANLSRFRIIVQILTFFLFVYGAYAGIHISEQLPTFSCPYNEGSPGTCYLISMQHRLHITWEGMFGYRGMGLLKSIFVFLLFFIFLNKAWCGFVCPLGTMQDWITKIREALNIRFAKIEGISFKRVSWIKYIFLGLLIIIPLAMANSFFGLPKISHDMSAPFCQICPGRTIFPLLVGDSSQLFIDYTNKTTLFMSTLAMAMLALFFVGSFVKKRFFCFICPMSALQYIFSKLGLLRLIKEGKDCTKCGNCSRVCDIGIQEIETNITKKNLVTENCMMCFKCVEACPENDCLKIKFLGITIWRSTSDGFTHRSVIKTDDPITKSTD